MQMLQGSEACQTGHHQFTRARYYLSAFMPGSPTLFRCALLRKLFHFLSALTKESVEMDSQGRVASADLLTWR